MIQTRETPHLSELIKKLKRNIHALTHEETALIGQCLEIASRICLVLITPRIQID